MKRFPQNIELTGTVEFKAPAEGETSVETFDLVCYSGSVVRVGNFWHPVVVDITGAKFDKKVTPVIMDHDTTKRVGHTAAQDIGEQITAKAIRSSKSKDSEEFWADLKAGYPFQCSIGATILKAEFLDDKKTATVNGKQVTGPLVIARKSTIRELSVTVLGADSRTSVKGSHDPNNFLDLELPTMNFEAWVASLGLTLSTLSPELTATLRENYKKIFPEQGTPPNNPNPNPIPQVQAGGTTGTIDFTAQRQAQADEALRLSEIGALALRFQGLGNTEIEVDGQKFAGVGQLQAHAIKAGWSREKMELACLRNDRPQSSGPSIHSKTQDIKADALECAILRSIAPDVPRLEMNKTTGEKYGLETMYSPEVLQASHGKQYDGVCLHQLMDLSIQAAGQYYNGSRKSEGYMKTFLHADKQIQFSGGFTTLAVGNLLESVANKVLLASFKAQETVWQFFTGVQNLSDFKPHNMYRLGVNGAYGKVPASGELKHGELSSSKRTLQGDTYGMIISLTRRDMINDDLSAFRKIPSELGRLANLAIENAFWTLLLNDPDNFFDAANGNYVVGADSVLGIPGLTKGALAMSNFVDEFGKPILAKPDRILVGSHQEVYANQLYKDVSVINGTDTNDLSKNPHAGLFRPYASPYPNNTAIRDMDGNAFENQGLLRWWMFANPAVIAAIVVGFLNGKRTPVIESAEADFETLGMKWRSYHDWGLDYGDEQGAVEMKGAA